MTSDSFHCFFEPNNEFLIRGLTQLVIFVHSFFKDDGFFSKAERDGLISTASRR